MITNVTTKEKTNNKRTEISVEEISNGFILSTYTSWDDPKKGYQSKTTKEYFKENPLDPKIQKLDIIKEALGK